MELWELLLIGVGLSMDAFAVSICKGLTARQATLGRCLTAGAYFGGFQALMPLLGYLLGTRLEAFIVNVDHWIAFLLSMFVQASEIPLTWDFRECRAVIIT